MSAEKLAVHLGDHIEILSGFAFSSSFFDAQQGLPLVRIRDLGSETTAARFRGPFDSRFLLSNGDVLVGMDGDFVVVRWNGGPALLNQRVCRVRAKGSLGDGFLFRILRPIVQQIHNRTAATTVRHLSTKDLERATVDLPPPREQQKIAEILDTVDEAIRKTDQIIAKLKHVKQGLLHDLLTRGIDDNGELRDPERHPEQFKPSPLGRIPKAWDVQRIEQLLATVNPAMRSGPFGSALLKSELVEQGVPLVGIDNVHVERFERAFTRFVSPAKAADLSRYSVRPNDVMITIMGTVGRCCVVPEDLDHALSTKHVWTLTFDSTRYSPFLACLQINFAPWVLRHFAKDEQGGIMSAIRAETLRTALLPVPPADEIRTIEQILRTHSARLAGEEAAVHKLRLLKVGLAEDLLTGKVRVTNLLEPSP